jgi:hypothetical protein
MDAFFTILGVVCMFFLTIIGALCLLFGHFESREDLTYLGWGLVAISFVTALAILATPTAHSLPQRF